MSEHPDSQNPSSEDTSTEARRPRPTPTGRARRAAAAGVGNETHRPSPRPSTGAAPARTDPIPDLTKPRPKPAAKPKREERAEDEVWTPKATTTRHRESGRAPLLLAVILGVLVLAGVAALVFATTFSVSAGSTSERDQALAAAKSEVPTILSYDYKTFDAGLAKSKAVLTGRAVDDYTKAMTTSIKPNAVKVKAVVQASTDGAGVESVSDDGKQVTVVVFGEQKVTNSTLSAPRVDLFRVRATLDLVKGKWLVSKFDQI